MKRWEEITGRDDDGDIGWQHADIEYWYESKKYAVRWKCDLQEQKLMASAVWMVLNPNQPEAPQLPADWHMAAVFIFMVLVAFSGVVWNVIN